MTRKIISTYPDFDQPLREAGRKQVYSRALEYATYGLCEIFCITKSNYGMGEHGNIKLYKYSFVTLLKKGLRSFRTEEVEIHSAMFQFKILILTLLFNVKSIYLYDGEPLPCNEGLIKGFSRKIAYFFSRFLVKSVFVFSSYQEKNLGKAKINKIIPNLPAFYLPEKVARSATPTLLYMGHLSKEKGCHTIIEMMELFAKDEYDIKLVIADNSIHTNTEMQLKLQEHLQKWDNIHVKGVVNPWIELSKCWVYLYPFTTPRGTMAFSLSIHEAIMTQREVIACDVGANREFFPDINYISTEKIGDAKYMMELVKTVIKNAR